MKVRLRCEDTYIEVDDELPIEMIDICSNEKKEIDELEDTIEVDIKSVRDTMNNE